jgi:phosphoribosylanthranilate isomerase
MPRLIKICGLTNLADARCACAAGADLLGFICYPPSPRYVAPDALRELLAGLPPEVPKVGVFVNTPAAEVLALARHAGLTHVQCHGQEGPEHLRALAPLVVLKAVALRSAADLAPLAEYAPWLLVADTPSPQHGGTGQVGDWGLAATAARQHRLLLAGGLTPANVAAALAAVNPAGVDVASGVERRPGVKDHDRLRAFITAVRSAP